jgi:hypothetical protein
MTDSLLQPGEDTPTIDPQKNYLEELVGEGKKFKTVEDLARGKAESDLFIQHKNREFDSLAKDYLALREEYNTGPKLQELIDRLAQQQQLASSDHTPANEDTKPVMDSKEMESLISSKIQEHETSRKQEANFNLVREKLKERFGNNYKDTFRTQIEELGLTENFVNQLAREQPRVFIRTFGLDAPINTENFQTPPKSNQRSDSFAPRGAEKRTWAYYQKMKKDQPKLYLEPKTQVQMHQDAISLGDEFTDGDWSAVR